MDSVAMAEELAWLIKDNLSCKHLVLSAEEVFVAFLNPQKTSSVENMLTLEPMAAYHRMLLHRLADIFRLAHESIGQGEDRRLVLGRCEDSYIPDVLVSDILVCYDAAQLSSPNAPLILKRNQGFVEAHKYTSPQSAQVSFEERQAAYLAARERIFSNDLHGDSLSESHSSVPRPRCVPVVARRMIAHALGKRISAEQDLRAHGARVGTHGAHGARGVGTDALDKSCTNLGSEDSMEPSVVDATRADDAGLQAETSKAVDYLQVKAAKRMFAQALGLGSSKSPCNVSNKGVEKKVIDMECLQIGEAQVGLSPGVADKLKDGRVPLSNCDRLGLVQLEQGRAAQRMLAQALGFRSLSIVAERSKDS